jgi:hypothetical protein
MTQKFCEPAHRLHLRSFAIIPEKDASCFNFLPSQSDRGVVLGCFGSEKEMTKTELQLIKEILQQMTNELENEDLTLRERDRLSILKTQFEETLLATWLPADWGRRVIVTIIAAAGIAGLIMGNYFFLVLWLALPVFSPKAMAELSWRFERTMGLIRWDSDEDSG